MGHFCSWRVIPGPSISGDPDFPGSKPRRAPHFWSWRTAAPTTSPIPCYNEGVKGLKTPWGRVTHICVTQLTIIGSDNGLTPGRRQAIIWTNVGMLLIGPLGTNFSEILIEIIIFSFKKMRLKVSSAKWRPFCLGLNVLNVKEWKPNDDGASTEVIPSKCNRRHKEVCNKYRLAEWLARWPPLWVERDVVSKPCSNS